MVTHKLLRIHQDVIVDYIKKKNQKNILFNFYLTDKCLSFLGAMKLHNYAVDL